MVVEDKTEQSPEPDGEEGEWNSGEEGKLEKKKMEGRQWEYGCDACEQQTQQPSSVLVATS